jgi:hypothetical protein
MKKNNKTILIIAVIVTVLIGYYFYSQGKIDLGNLGDKLNLDNAFSDRGNNGYWNVDSQECWTTPTSLNGGSQESNVVSCCFDQEGYQVDCTDASKRLSSTQMIFAVYAPQGLTATPGIFSVAHTITIANTGSVALEKVWIDTAVWSSSPSNPTGNLDLTTAYARILGETSTYAGAIAVGGASKSFPTLPISLQDLDVTASGGTIYTLALNAKARAYNGQLTSSLPLSRTMKITKEAIGFSVDIVWGI